MQPKKMHHMAALMPYEKIYKRILPVASRFLTKKLIPQTAATVPMISNKQLVTHI